MCAKNVFPIAVGDLCQISAVKGFGDADVVLFVFETCIPVVGDVAAYPIGFWFYNGPLGGDVLIFLPHQTI